MPKAGLEPLPECTGVITRIIYNGFYCFVREDTTRRDLFAHGREFAHSKFTELREGDRVKFLLSPSYRKSGRFYAIDVTVIEKAASPQLTAPKKPESAAAVPEPPTISQSPSVPQGTAGY